MLPDFRFVLGAILAITLLAVAGLGLVTSVRLVQEARISPIEDARSLAFAGHAEWNQFYDADGARRFEGLAGKTEGPATEAGLETPAETSVIAPPVVAPPVSAQVGPEDRIASIPANRPDPDISPEVADGKTPEINPPQSDPPPSAETPMAVTIAAPTEAAAAPVPAISVAPPAQRVASAPATSPGPDRPEEAKMPTPAAPQAAGDQQPESAPPAPRARPNVHLRRKIARRHMRGVAPASQQTWQNSGFPTSSAWPGYDNQFTGASSTKNTGKLTGTLSNRPQ
jgi:hypothetical protein